MGSRVLPAARPSLAPPCWQSPARDQLGLGGMVSAFGEPQHDYPPGTRKSIHTNRAAGTSSGVQQRASEERVEKHPSLISTRGTGRSQNFYRPHQERPGCGLFRDSTVNHRVGTHHQFHPLATACAF